jgi:hypothetical protein
MFRAGALDMPFDHSVCQYPDRVTNPPDGCNNMDPARPECMKFGLEDCDLPNPTEPKAEPVPIPAPVVVPAPLEQVEIQYEAPEIGK